MKDETILKLAIEKAEKGGYEIYDVMGMVLRLEGWHLKIRTPDNTTLATIHLYAIIFDKDFVKAFWGEGNEVAAAFYGCHDWDEDTKDPAFNPKLKIDKSMPFRIAVWEYHLQQMVLEENPLKYLESFLS